MLNGSIRLLSFSAVLLALGVTGCATQTPATVAQDQRTETRELNADQKEDSAAFDRMQQDERSGLKADQAQERSDVAMSNAADQQKFVIDARERVAKLDARIAEQRKLGRPVDQATVDARTAVLAHIELSDDTPMTHATWMKHRDEIDAELTALSNAIDRQKS